MSCTKVHVAELLVQKYATDEGIANLSVDKFFEYNGAYLKDNAIHHSAEDVALHIYNGKTYWDEGF